MVTRCLVIALLAMLVTPSIAADSDPLERFATLALDCVHREYPNKIAHVLSSDDDVAPPRELTPVFYGCFDWHSAVHGHWLLTRYLVTRPDGSLAEKARAALAKNITVENVAGELAYMSGADRTSWERPYGLAWFLKLMTELRGWNDEQGQAWMMALKPLEAIAADRFRDWLPKLAYPIRTGEHSQTAFAFGFVYDWAMAAGDKEMMALLDRTAIASYGRDTDCPLAYEPSGQDFLSPCLAEADFMRRVLPEEDFGDWLGSFLPGIPAEADSGWLAVGVVTDRVDGKLAHIDGLNISRAWMLWGVFHGLPADDERRSALEAAACAHERAGLDAVTGEHYAGGHWLGSFAMYLTTNPRGDCAAEQ